MTAKPHLLMVDDSVGDLRLVGLALDDARVEVAFNTAADGIHGQAFLQRLVTTGQALPKVVLLDLNMPRMDGGKLLAWIRQADGCRDLPVIMFTSSSDPRERALCLAAGATDYWVKPTSFQDYAAFVARLVPHLHAQ